MKLALFVPFLAVLAALLACGGATTDQLRARAAFDLQCEEAQLSVVKIDERTQGVRGCGQQATYVESCDGPKGGTSTECTWVMNTDSRRQ